LEFRLTGGAGGRWQRRPGHWTAVQFYALPTYSLHDPTAQPRITGFFSLDQTDGQWVINEFARTVGTPVAPMLVCVHTKLSAKPLGSVPVPVAKPAP
jgi:hypothetical protein